jgi:hypothetical protein
MAKLLLITLLMTLLSYVSPYVMTDSDSSNKVSYTISYIDSLSIEYDDVTDESITTAILDASDKFRLNDDELQQVVDHYAD